MDKKGIELTMNTIIVAALALLVLVVLMLLFTGSFGDFSRTFLGIKDKVTSKADCVVIGGDSANDKDGDGLHDSKEYDKIIKDEGGEKSTVKCPCDPDKGTGGEENIPDKCKDE